MSTPLYQLTLGSDDHKKHVTEIEFASRVDAPSELHVRTAYAPKAAMGLGADKFSAQASLKVYDRGVFQGSLVDIISEERGVFKLVYADSFSQLENVTESDFFKGLTLEDYLRRVSSLVGVTPRFKGNFGQALPAFNVTGTPILDHVQALSEAYGYYFVSRPFAQEALFQKLDQFAQAEDIDLSSEPCIASMHVAQSSQGLYRAGEVRFFDSQSQKSEKKEISQDELYAPLGYLKQSRSFEKRAKRSLSTGREERLALQNKQYAEGAELLAAELSKEAFAKESLRLEFYSLPALVGDKVTIKGTRFTDAEGSYLVHGLKIGIRTHRPLVEMELGRA